MQKISKLLIANRGEIACRIIRTCRQKSIKSVAVYSDADAFARHVRQADEAVHIGGAAASDSYLNGQALIRAAMAAGAEAIHPAYGLLSENADFAKSVLEAGLIWIGPAPDTIEALGLKDRAKALAEAAGVPVLPGYRGQAQDMETLSEAADQIGYPLLIKAVAGGGGRGIRQVDAAETLGTALESAVREAEAAFGDGRVMLEKLVVRPRHIEVQVFGDGQGGAVHLFERDCSMQRRRQKVVEEAPAPGMPDNVREAMCSAAVKLAGSVKYAGAGTVEFIVDGAQPLTTETFWFLEMNTRLQVEHPVTEMITDIDLVDWQIRVAQGEGLPCGQKDLSMHGHAIEVRICAEDPADDFRPGAGLIEAFDMMADSDADWLRWETGFEAGDKVPSNYDSMIAKLIIWGPDRSAALSRLTETLAHLQLVGVPGNAGFLRRCIMSSAFKQGQHHVNWIAEQGRALTDVPPEHKQAAISAICDIVFEDRDPGPWGKRDGWRLNGVPHKRISLMIDQAVEQVQPGESRHLADNLPISLVTDLSPRRFAVTTGGDSLLIELPDFEAEAEALMGGDQVRAPMPGKLISLNVAVGDQLQKGDVVAVMEAMKMEHTLSAPRPGEVESLPVSAGTQISEGTVIMTLRSDS